jgi:general secretion pathway protein G
MFHKKNTLQPGMSFIEIIIVITIMALFAALAGPKLMSVLGRGKKAVTTNNLKVVASAIQQYKVDTGMYPNKLEDLVKKPEGISGWQEPYVGTDANPEVPKDGWGQDFDYKLNPARSTPAYELYSKGDPDKAEEERIYAK